MALLLSKGKTLLSTVLLARVNALVEKLLTKSVRGSSSLPSAGLVIPNE